VRSTKRCVTPRRVSARARRHTAPRGGVYSYETAQGTRWRFVFRRKNGKQTSKRGFMSRSAAYNALRRLIEIDRGEIRHTDEMLGGWWERWLRRRNRTWSRTRGAPTTGDRDEPGGRCRAVSARSR